MPQPTNSFKTLGGGVPVHYDRLASPHHYGSRGKEHTFHCKTDFEPLLDNAFRDVWLYTGLGKAEVITSTGAYVNKPGQHGQGRALDIDGIFWSNKTFVTLHAGWQGQDRNFYFGIEAVLRMHFGVVLDYEYNAPHRDHFHADDSQGLGFRKSSRSMPGPDLMGKLGLIWLVLVWVSGYAVQVGLASAWLRHFRFGPAEWLWRSLTYWKIQRLRMAVPAAG